MIQELIIEVQTNIKSVTPLDVDSQFFAQSSSSDNFPVLRKK
jgi:hypothetical protein